MTQNNDQYQRMDNRSDINSSTQYHQAEQQPQHISQSAMTRRERHKRVLYALGITELVVGSLSVLLAIVTLIIAATNLGYYYEWSSGQPYFQRYYHDLTWSSQGIWCGAFAIVCGVLGVKAKSNPSVCMYNANMAMSIIGANVMGVLMILSSLAAGNGSYRLHGLIVVLVAVHSLIAILAFSGMVICIVHSAYCCAGVCCRRKPNHGVVMCVAQPGYQPQQMVQLANGHYMMVPAQAMAAQYPVPPAHMVGGQVVYQLQGVVAPVNMGTPQSHHTPMPVIPQQATTSYPAQQVVHAFSKEQEAQMQVSSENPPGYTLVPPNQL